MAPPWRGLRVCVLGLGSFGGQTGAVRWLHRQGARVTVSDRKAASELEPGLQALADLEGVAFDLGSDGVAAATGADLVVASPAVPPGAPAMAAARARGVPVTSEIALFLERCPGPCWLVTGSSGKTTTTHLLAAMARAAGRKALVAGNAGGGGLGCLEAVDAGTIVALEISSFMLEALPAGLRAGTPGAGGGPCAAGAVTALAPNHLDRHGSLEAYIAAKGRLLDLLPPGAPLALPAEDPAAAPLRARAAGRPGLGLVGLSGPGQGVFVRHGRVMARRAEGETEVFTWEDLRRAASHLLQDAMTAAWLALGAGCSPQAVRAGVRAWQGLPHRLEELPAVRGVRFVNDSAATTAESVRAALEALRPAPLRLLLGGVQKGGSPGVLVRAVTGRCASLHVYGRAGPAIHRLLAEVAPGEAARTTVHPGLEEALREAWIQARPEDVVLLSPGLASYDQFTHFEERGQRFRELVAALAGDRGGPPEAAGGAAADAPSGPVGAPAPGC